MTDWLSAEGDETPPGIAPEQVAAYLSENGWKRKTVGGNSEDYWKHAEWKAVYWLAPCKEDYMWWLRSQVTNVLSQYENRPASLILADMAAISKGDGDD